MKTVANCLLSILIISVFALIIGCKRDFSSLEASNQPPPPLPSNLTLFASFDGDKTGISLFNPNTFQLQDSVNTTPAVPWGIEFSQDNSTWYFVLKQNSASQLIAFNPLSKTIIQSVNTTGTLLSSDKDQNLLITYGYEADRTQIFKRNDLSLVHQDSLGLVIRVVTSPNHLKMYATHQEYNTGQFTGILVYNLESFSIEKEIIINQDHSQIPSDLEISSDGRYLFLATFYGPLHGLGRFYAIHLETSQIIASYYCGSMAQIGRSPDGKSVYISDPAGYQYMLSPTGILLKYDIESREMEEFIDWVPYNLTNGAWQGRLPTDQIVVGPDSRTMFLTTFGAGITPDGKDIDILKIDLLTKEILDVLSLPRNPQGFQTEIIVGLKLGNYP